MDPYKASARFAAYVWFSNRKGGAPVDATEAVNFAKDHWAAFLPCADEGIGRLLIRVAALDRKGGARQRQLATAH
jgi:hypothetical protein